MNKNDVLAALKQMRDSSKKRKFDQSIEYIMNFTGIDFKKADKRIDVDVILPHATGKKADVKILVFARDANFAEQLNGRAEVIMESEIPKLDKKRIAEISTKYDALLAEGPTMIPVGKYLGQQLAPKGKMPKPIQPRMAVFEDVIGKLSVGIKITNKKGKFMPVVQTVVGRDSSKDAEIAENIMAIYSAVVPTLEKRTQNIKSQYLKFSMGAPVRIAEAEKK